MPNGSSILRLIDAVLKETQRQARGAEAQRLIQHAIQRVAAISAAQGLLPDPDGVTRINSWDLLTAICLIMPLPIQDTVEGEPLEIYPFLGCGRLEEPLNRYPIDGVFHGHAHHGQPRGKTKSGVPVLNVAHALMKKLNPERPFHLEEVASTEAGSEG